MAYESPLISFFTGACNDQALRNRDTNSDFALGSIRIEKNSLARLRKILFTSPQTIKMQNDFLQ
jgi:hypothetical protein